MAVPALGSSSVADSHTHHHHHHFGGAYLPAQSALLHVAAASDCFAALTEAASAASALGKEMLIGDANASLAARPALMMIWGSSLEALHLPVVHACTESFSEDHGRHLLHLCLSTGLVLGTARLAGDAHAAMSTNTCSWWAPTGPHLGG